MKMHEFSKTAEIREGKSHALSLKLAFISLFAASALTAMADARETLGLWTFNGESGTYACGNKEEFVFPNRVERSVTMFLVMNGRPTVADVERKLSALSAGGVDSFMLYPASGLKLDYLGREFFDIARAFADGAKRRNMKMWLYDEFNWPSGTCLGRIPAESDDFKLTHLTCAREGGGFAWSRQFARPTDVSMITSERKRGWTNLLEPRAVDRFIELTHEAYARELAPYFTNGVIRGIFTDEPFHMAPVDLPEGTVASFRWYDGLEADYAAISGGRNFRADVEAWAASTNREEDAEVWIRYNELYARRFKSAYFDKITAWATAKGILSTGHMIVENDPRTVLCNGDPLQTLSALSFPGMDEIHTWTAPGRIEWQTLHTVQYAIRRNGRGGMAELFACGPANLTPGECLKMIRICALHGVTRYFTVMSTMDASWMDEILGFTTTFGEQQPWFAEFPLFLDAADEASRWAAKRAILDVAVRFPRRQIAVANAVKGPQPPVSALLGALERAQIGVDLIREEDETSAPVVLSFDGGAIREERTGKTFASVADVPQWVAGRVPERFVLRDENGERVPDVLVRNYPDGTHAYVRLGDEPEPKREGRRVEIGGDWDLSLSAPPTLRLPFDTNGLCRLVLEKPVSGLRLATRGAPVLVDGKAVEVSVSCDVLRPSFNELYKVSPPFALAAGEHVFQLPPGMDDMNWFLPAAFVAGAFSEKNGRILPLPGRVPAGTLESCGLAGFCGKATWGKVIDVPAGGDVRLCLDTGGHFTRVRLGGRDLGAVGWGDFSWRVPQELRGRRLKLEIDVYTSLKPLFGATAPAGAKYYKFYRAPKQCPCGLLSPPEWRVAEGGDYLVIDLSGGKDAASYPVSRLDDVPQGGWTDEYKTSRLVLRRIEPGTCTMGCETNEAGFYGYEAVPHAVTISKPFYMGVFEVTQKQYELVTGLDPSSSKGAARPVECVSWDDIRGGSPSCNWPASSGVDASSFVGLLRAKTGIATFDLPTEAKWEYACRAGTDGAFDGVNDMSALGRYRHNLSAGKGGYSDAHTTVGSYLPNAWGLYDMHGNVWEWCLDWYQSRSSFPSAAVIDPVGPAVPSFADDARPRWPPGRVLRGGSWDNDVERCRAAARGTFTSTSGRSCGRNIGFRLCCAGEECGL